MKTIKQISIFTFAVISALACTKYNEDALPADGEEIIITAAREGFSAETKTVRESDGSVAWCPLDAISVFYTGTISGGSKFTSQNSEKTAIAEFRGKLDGFTAGGEAFTNGKYLYGVYPYSTNTSFKDGVATIVLPSQQTAVEGTFANGLFPTIARAQSVNLAFYNICGGVKFTVSRDDITSVTLKGNNGERLAGSAKVAFDDTDKPVVLEEEVASKSVITMYAPAGGTFEVGKEYYFVAYPGKLSSGFTITFRTSDMKEGTYVSESAVEIRRSIFGVLDQVDKNVTSWSDIISNGGGSNTGIYLGITGFNQQLYTYPIEQLSNTSKPGFDTFIDDLNMKNGTLLYYSVDQAINTLQSVTLPEDLSTAAIVTFTDGLDQGSMMMNVAYNDDTEYLNALNHRIMNETVNQLPITAFSIGIRGQDVTDVTKFRNNLAKLASSSSNATEVTSMAEVNAKFKEIAEQLSQNNFIQTINLKMPGVSNGTLVRFTFDNVKSADKSSLYIEGTFNLAERSLENIKYVGLKSSSGTKVKGVVDGIFVTFTFEKVHTDNNKLIDNQFTDEWTYVTSNRTWQINSEFDKTENSEIVTVRSSAVIMLVLDCSSSLADGFATALNNAKDFINTLYDAVGGDSGSDENPDTGDNAIYSTAPKDLSLAIWKDGTRYYLTQAEYYVANLSDAIIEGLTIIAGGESFILSLNDIQSGSISNVETAKNLYGDILPTANQGVIISAKYVDINDALSRFGGTRLSSYYYTSSTTLKSGYYNSVIYGSGGSLYNNGGYPYIRGVKSANNDSVITWTNPNDLKLSVIIDGTRVFLGEDEYHDRSGEIESIEGVAVFAGGERFAIQLNNAQSGSISNVETAMDLYSDILPTVEQGVIISAKYEDINDALSRFGGTRLSSSSYYYTSSTTLKSGYYNSVISGSGGSLYNNGGSPYIRGVVNFE